MNYMVCGHNCETAVREMAQVFYPNENFKLIHAHLPHEVYIKSTFDGKEVLAELFDGDTLIGRQSVACVDISQIQRCIKLGIYEMLKRATGQNIAWGILTGIRPAKIATELFNKGLDDEGVFNEMKKAYLSEDDKVKLSIEVSKAERLIIESNDGNDYSIYIGVPFCPTRCLYCSFTAYPIDKYVTKVDAYVKALKKEMQYAKQFGKNRRLESIYIGGGTPTSINSTHFEAILSQVYDNFDVENLKEFTVEAGRPDTINAEKLAIMKKYGVTRISVNPQTMNDKTLKLIGRKHSAEEFSRAFRLARDKGFQDINVDLILGLINENLADVQYTFDKIAEILPEGVTVHTLAVKRASRLKEELADFSFISQSQMESFLKLSRHYMDNMGLKPYYMYRQKNMVGNYENVGYVKPGYEGIYNIQIMEEKQTIIALGAGSTSKFVDLKTNRIERAFNVKDVDEYIARIDEMIGRKAGLEEMLC